MFEMTFATLLPRLGKTSSNLTVSDVYAWGTSQRVLILSFAAKAFYASRNHLLRLSMLQVLPPKKDVRNMADRPILRP